MGKPVGLIANPASGRDIRRLVAHASVIDNVEKANMVRRIIATLDAMGVEEMLVMPETFGIAERALSLLPQKPRMRVEFLEMHVNGDWTDTLRASEMMKGNVSAMISIGGDGTNRVIAKSEIDEPLLPISTGTNNVFPFMIEATIAALAVGAVALGAADPNRVSFRSKRVEILRDGKLEDIALVEASATLHQFVGSRAVWRMELVREIVASVCAPYNIGLSSIPGSFFEIGERDDGGAYVSVGEEGEEVIAPIAPGALKSVKVRERKRLREGESVVMETSPSVLAFDGEREMVVKEGEKIEARVVRKGPRVIEYREAIREGVRNGLLSPKFSYHADPSLKMNIH
ncbi:MAG: NAD(+)/NADH kinase [Fervidicoccaceae archaeon]|uniref:ATP-NAD kinase n=1 Tax=Fervidicoccus fontis TaxID=683846 RepID=A0A7C2YSS7_9CREN|nr:MAG: ATP-NAD kinase [Fervidicoccus sp.]HEU97298.1 ATP-NAD kinase [Fervidicoccus fontis]